MSRTKRIIRTGFITTEFKEGGDAMNPGNPCRPRKLKPFAKKITGDKFKPERYEYVTGFQKGISKKEKLNTTNANRALKKGKRQQLKKETVSALEEFRCRKGHLISDYLGLCLICAAY